MTRRQGIHAHTWAMHSIADELEHVHEIKHALLDALAAKLLQIPQDAIADITELRRGMTEADYKGIAERNAGIDACLLVGTITDVLQGQYTRVSVQEALLMCHRAGLRPRITFD